MSRYFDTSVLAKLYVHESGSARVAHLVRSERESLVFSMLHELELVNGLRLKVFRKEAMSVEIDASLKRVRRDLASGVLARPLLDWAAARASISVGEL